MRIARLPPLITLIAITSCQTRPPNAQPLRPPDSQTLQLSDAQTLRRSDVPPLTTLLSSARRETLPNGLNVIVVERRGLPAVSAWIWYSTGSADETPGKTGLSHFLEHLMFKGTDRYAKGEIDRITLRLGGANNAFTAEDYTGYYFDFAADRWETALEIEANRMRNCRFDPAEFEAERRVVLEELNRDLDDPWGRLTREHGRRLFAGTPYAHPVLGWEEEIAKVPRDDVIEYYRRRYVPSRATIVLVGDLDADRALARVRTLFGPIGRGGDDAPPPAAPESAAGDDRRVEIPSPYDRDRLLLGFRAVPVGHADDFTLDVAAGILAGGRSSRLHRRLVEEARVAADVVAANDARRLGGAFTIQVELLPGRRAEEAERILDEELSRLGRDPAAAAELDKARNRIEADFLFGKETAHGLAESVGHFAAIGKDGYLKDYLDRIRAVDAPAVRAVAAKLLIPANRWTGVARASAKPGPGGGGQDHTSPPKRAFPGKSSHPARLCVLRPTALTAGPAFVKDEVWNIHLLNGLTVLGIRRSDLPLLVATAHVEAGPLIEASDRAGVANLLGEMLAEGAGTRTGPQIADAIESVGGSLETGPLGATVRVLSRDRELALDLLADLLRRPAIPDGEPLDRVRENVLADLRARAEDAETLAHDLFRAAVYGNHPLGRPPAGLPETVKRLTRDDLAAHHRRAYRPERTAIVLVGDIDPAAAIEGIRRRFEDWRAAEPLDAPPLPAVPLPKAARMISQPLETEQVHLVIGHPGIRRNDPHYADLLVLDHILGTGPGFTDRISKEIRDKQGLAYTANASITASAGLEPGTFRAYAGVSPENREKAREGILGLIRELIAKGVTDGELADAKAYLKGSLPLRAQSREEIAGILVEAHRYGLGADWLERLPAKIDAVTKEQVEAAAKKHLHPDRMIVVEVGPVR